MMIFYHYKPAVWRLGSNKMYAWCRYASGAADLTRRIKILEVVRAVLLGDDSGFRVVPTQPAVPRTITHGL